MTKVIERRLCSKCKKVKSISDFNKGNNIDGFHSYCRSCININCKESYHKRKKENPKQFLKQKRLYGNVYRQKNIIRARELAKAYHERRRLKILTNYGGNPPECYCCGETEIKFLGIDHLKGGGLAHLRKIGRGSLPSWLVKNKFPKGFGVLCHNCNFAKGHYGQCPHKEILK